MKTPGWLLAGTVGAVISGAIGVAIELAVVPLVLWISRNGPQGATGLTFAHPSPLICAIIGFPVFAIGSILLRRRIPPPPSSN